VQLEPRALRRQLPDRRRPVNPADVPSIMAPVEVVAVAGGAAPAPATAAPSLPLLARLKLTEPVRLYCYSMLLVLSAGLQLAGLLTGEWPEFIATNGAVVLAVASGTEAARASVYSPRSVVQAVRRAADR
jgi:hypothetical protein